MGMPLPEMIDPVLAEWHNSLSFISLFSSSFHDWEYPLHHRALCDF